MKLIDLANRRRAVILANFEFDTDFQAVIDKAIAESFDLPPYNVLRAMNYFVIQLKGFGIWSKLDTIFNFATGLTGYEDFTGICLKRRVLGTDNGTLTFTTEGREGNGSNYFFDTQYNPSVFGGNYALNDASKAGVVYNLGGGSITQMTIDGILSTNIEQKTFNFNTSAQRINSGTTQLNAAANLSGSGLKTINRQSSTNVMLTSKSTEINRTSPSSSINNENIVLFISGGQFSFVGTASWFAGSALTYIETQDFRAVYNQYLDRIGLTQFA